MFPGGIADKLGNIYEAKWLVRQFLDVVAGQAEWGRFEGIVPEYKGFEFAVRRGQHTEWHQTKINSASGNWTIGALDKEGVLKAFKARLSSSDVDRCVFVSQDPAKSLSTLAGKAATANTLDELTAALSQDQVEDFKRLVKAWSVDESTSYGWLRRSEVRVLPEKEINDTITTYCNLYFTGNGASTFPILRQYLEARFNKTLTTELVRAELPAETSVRLKDWSLLPTLRQRLQEETNHYLDTYEPFGFKASKLPRQEADELVRLILADDGPIVVLLTGIAGSGKSGVVRTLLKALARENHLHLAFRVDHHLAPTNPHQLGQELLERAESPVVTLKGLSPSQPTAAEVDIVLKLDEPEKSFSPLVRQALLGSPGWFDQLNWKGWLKRQLDFDHPDRRQSLFWWLSSVAAQRPGPVAELLEEWWKADLGRSDALLDWLSRTRQIGASPALAQFCEALT